MGSEVFEPKSLTRIVFRDKGFPKPSFIATDGRFPLKPASLALDLWLSRQIINQTEPQDLNLLAWVRWYFKKEVVDVESQHTSRSKAYDMWKFVVFFLHRTLTEDLTQWDKPCSQSFINALEAEYDISTVDRIYATLTNFWAFLVVQEAVKAKDNPLKGTKKRRSQQLPPARGLDVLSNVSSAIPQYTGAEKYGMFLGAAKSLIGKAKKYQSPRRDVAIISFLYGTGVRADELCGLIIDQMDRDVPSTGGCWFHNVTGKGKITRRVYLPKENLEDLDAYLNSDEHPDNDKSTLIFHSRNGKRLHQKDLWNILDRLADLATQLYLPPGYIFRVTPHTLRHQRGFYLKEAGHGEQFIALALGHIGTSQVPRYSMGDDDKEAEAYEKKPYNPPLNVK